MSKKGMGFNIPEDTSDGNIEDYEAQTEYGYANWDETCDQDEDDSDSYSGGYSEDIEDTEEEALNRAILDEDQDSGGALPSALQLYLNEVNLYEPFTPEEEKECLTRMANGDKYAEKELFHANMRLVISIALKFHCQRLELLDLIQYGNFGLIRAISKYDIKRGTRFSTYATPWIKNFIQRNIIQKDRCMDIPAYVGEAIHKIRKIEARYEAEFLRLPTDQEIMEETGLTPTFMKSIAHLREKDVSLDEIVNTQQGDRTFVEMLPIEEKGYLNAEAKGSRETLYSEIDRLLVSMSDERREAFYMLFGIRYNRAYDPAEIADELGIKKKEVDKIRTEALDILSVSENKDLIYKLLYDQAGKLPDEVGETVH